MNKAIMLEVTRKNTLGAKVTTRALWTLGESRNDYLAAVKYARKLSDVIAWSVEIVNVQGDYPSAW